MDEFKIKSRMYGKRVQDVDLSSLEVAASSLLATVEVATGANVDSARHTEWSRLLASQMSMSHPGIWLSELGYAAGCWIAGELETRPQATPAAVLWCLGAYVRSDARRGALHRKWAEVAKREVNAGRPSREALDKLYEANIAAFRHDWCAHGEIRDYICAKAVSYAYDWYVERIGVEVPSDVATRIRTESETELSILHHAGGAWRVGRPTLGDVMRRKGLEWLFSQENDLPEYLNATQCTD